jgi:hypothetical protein
MARSAVVLHVEGQLLDRILTATESRRPGPRPTGPRLHYTIPCDEASDVVDFTIATGSGIVVASYLTCQA